MLTKKTRRLFLAAAGALLVVAIVWSILLNNSGEGNRICAQVNRFGYAFTPNDLYTAGAWKDSSIRALLPEEDLQPAIEASKAAGFRSDVDVSGIVTLIMVNFGDNDAVMLFLVDDNIELAFVQAAQTMQVRPLGKR